MSCSNEATEKKMKPLSASKVIQNFYIEPTPRQIPRLSVERLGDKSEDDDDCEMKGSDNGALAVSYVYDGEDELTELNQLGGTLQRVNSVPA